MFIKVLLNKQNTHGVVMKMKTKRKMQVVAYVGLSLAFLAGSGCGRDPSASRSGGVSRLHNETSIENDDADYASFAFTGEVKYKPYGNHTNLFTIKVGPIKHPFGEGLVLSVKEVWAMGACVKYSVYDFKAHQLTWVEPFGNPSCPERSSVMPPAKKLDVHDVGFRTALGGILKLLDDVEKDSFTSDGDKAKLAPARAYLTSTVFPR